MKLISSLCLLAVALLATGCSDSSNNPASPGSTSTNDSFWPATKGSTWTYAGTQNYTITAGGDTTINGKKYTIMTNSIAGNSYLRRDGTSYYNLAVALGELLFFKDEAASTTWSLDITLNGIPTHQEYSLVEKGISFTVNGQSYSNVARVHLKESFVFGGQTQVFGNADYYYAKGVGLIRADLGAAGEENLTSYSIK